MLRETTNAKKVSRSARKAVAYNKNGDDRDRDWNGRGSSGMTSGTLNKNSKNRNRTLGQTALHMLSITTVYTPAINKLIAKIAITLVGCEFLVGEYKCF